MFSIAGVYFDDVDFDGAVDAIERYISEGYPHQIVTANADFVVKAQKDREFREVLNSADMVVADGMSIVFASKFLGNPLAERVAGIDLALELCRRSAEKGHRIFFLGAEESVGEKALKRLEAEYPGLNIAGYISPRFGGLSEKEEKEISQKIRESSADILLTCLTAGMQEKWIKRNMEHMGVPVCIGVGSFLDLVAGEFTRAPEWMRKAGLEWFFRIIQKPDKLFKRYIIDDSQFIFHVICQKMGRKWV